MKHSYIDCKNGNMFISGGFDKKGDVKPSTY
jgi:hypothetical protein